MIYPVTPFYATVITGGSSGPIVVRPNSPAASIHLTVDAIIVARPGNPVSWGYETGDLVVVVATDLAGGDLCAVGVVQ